MSEQQQIQPTKFETIIPIYPEIEAGLNIILIGAGGNGGYLVPNIMRAISTLPPALIERLDFKVVDFDVVETKNISRQLFAPSDVGALKAEVLVRRYATHFNVPPESVGFVAEKIETADQIVNLMSPIYTNLIIDCVDNRTARRRIYEGLVKFTAMNPYCLNYLMSSGTGMWTGQVGFGCYLRKKDERAASLRVPIPYAFHPEMIDVELDKKEDGLSCADRAALNVQSINANVTASTLLFNWVSVFLNNLEAIYTGADLRSIDVGMIYFNVDKNTFSDRKITPTYLLTENPRLEEAGGGSVYAPKP